MTPAKDKLTIAVQLYAECRTVIYWLSFNAVALAVFFSASAYAQVTQTIILPPLSVASNETAQVNLMSSAKQYPGWTFVWDCNATVSFYGSDGTLLAPPAKFTVSGTRQVFSSTLPAGSGGSDVSRVFVSARLTLTPAPASASALSPPVPACAVAFSFATVNGLTGETRQFVSGLAAGAVADALQSVIGGVLMFPCQSDQYACSVIFWGAPSQLIALPPMNLAPTEILEVAVISSAGATPYHTCTGSVGFYAADGNPIGAPVHFTVDDGLAIHSAEISGKDGILTARPHAVSAEISLTADPITIAYRGQTPPCVVTFSARTMDATTGDVHSSVGGQSTGTTQPIGASPTSLTRNPAHRH